jgi:hypothetical protein
VSVLLDDGRALRAPRDGDRIGAGPWSRWVASAVVPDESSARAERGRDLARSGAVHSVRVTPGSVAARVVGSKGAEYDVTLATTIVPASTWTHVTRAARSRPLLAPGVEGTSQSIHLAHLMETEHREPLVPPSRSIRASCTCPDREHGVVCKHVAAVAFVVAHAIDTDPTVLLRWRGCAPAAAPASRNADPWQAGPLPTPRRPRSLPPGAVVKRLGRSGIRVGSEDLADALEPAYRAFAALAPSAGDDTAG